MTRKFYFFTVLTALFLLAATNLRAQTSGTCGENVNWSLGDYGVLTITGSGAMKDYTYDSPAPWDKRYVQSVVIANGITTIGDYAFYECTGMSSVIIPSSVTSIGRNAFYYCSNLTSVDIPNSVKNIKEYAFAVCTRLTSLTIPASVESIGGNGFYYCDNLTSLTVSGSTSIGGGAFYYCKNLSKIECLAENPPTCAENAFDDDIKGTCVLSVPKTAVEAYKSALGWNSLANITQSVTVVESGTCGENVKWTLDDGGTLTISGSGAMNDFEVSSTPWKGQSFTKVVIKDGVTAIGELAFANDCTELTSVEIPNSVTSVGAGAFYNCTGLTSVEIPNSVTSIGEEAFAGCTGLTSVTLSNSLTDIAPGLFYECTGLTSIEIPSSVTSIGKTAFARCSGLTSVTFPETLTSIGKNAFVYCTKLKSVEIPASVTSIGSGAFGYCEGLTGVTIPASVTSIERNTFLGCSGLTSVTFPETLTSIGETAFYQCTGLTNVTFPASMEAIGDEAFAGCTGLIKIESLAENPPLCGGNAFSEVDDDCVLYVPEKSIDAYKDEDEWKDFTKIEALAKKVVAEGDCGDNAKWTLDEDGVLTISGTGAMKNYSSSDSAPWTGQSATSVVIGDGVTAIGNYAFKGCEGLKSVTISSSVTSIGEWAFRGCTGLTSVEIPSSVTSIGNGAFCQCSSLTSITIPSSVTSLAFGTFNACTGLTSITLPETLTSIGNGVFYNCSSLTSITIPASVTSIGQTAFQMCTGLSKIESLAENPPTCGSDCFDKVDKNTCVLTVPKKAVDAYKGSAVWKEFTNTVSGISGAAQENSAAVSASNGEITVTGAADNAVVEVYNTSGTLVYRGTGKTVAVPSAGVYIVRTAGSTFKVNTAR